MNFDLIVVYMFMPEGDSALNLTVKITRLIKFQSFMYCTVNDTYRVCVFFSHHSSVVAEQSPCIKNQKKISRSIALLNESK